MGKKTIAEFIENPDVTRLLGKSELEACFDLKYHLKHVDTVFKRVFGR